MAVELLLRFVWGSWAIMLFVSRKEASERFLKIAFFTGVTVLAVAVGLAKLSNLPHWQFESLAVGNSALIALMMASGFGIYCFSRHPLARFLGVAALLLGPIFRVFSSQNISFGVAAEILNFYLSGLVFGGVFGGQFLGHWYLTVAGLHIVELKRVVRLMLASFILKFFECGASLYWYFYQIKNTAEAEFGSLDHYQEMAYDIEGIFALKGSYFMGLGPYGVLLLSSRVVWGLVAPLIMGIMVHRTVTTRSTQSATGILYAMCVMVIVGEAIALYLSRALGVWF